MLEAVGRAYLVILALVTVAYLHEYGWSKLRRMWKWATVAVATGSLLAYVAIVGFGWADPTRLVNFFGNYPYLGPVYRLRGSAQTYGMLYMVLLPGLLFAYQDWRQRGGAVWSILLIFSAGILTFSKENLLFPIAVLLLEREWGGWRIPMAGLLTVALLLGTHYLIVPADADLSDAYTAKRIVWETQHFKLVESVYTPIKRVGLAVGAAHPWVGVGPGQFASYSETASPPNTFVSGFGPFDPHSTWTGAWAETGLFGLLSVLALTVCLFYTPMTLARPVGILLLLYLISSVFKDVANYRQLWLLIGWYLYASVKTQPITTYES